jgi:hypothetical protein
MENGPQGPSSRLPRRDAIRECENMAILIDHVLLPIQLNLIRTQK